MTEIMFNKESRRSDKRLNNPRVKSRIKQNERRLDADVLNICRRGLRFRSKEKFQNGDIVKIELSSEDEKVSLNLVIKGKIVNDYGKVTEDKHEYGVKFSRFLYWHEMNSIHDFVHSYIKR